MKRMPTTILGLILTMIAATRAQVPKHGVTALILIADSSWSCEQEIGDIRALIRQPITSLEPGDYLEIISARAGKPRIQLAQTIRTGDAQEMKNIDAAIGKLRSYFLTHASLPNALDMAIRRVGDACSKRQIDHVAIIVLTDGQVNDNHAQQILQLSEKVTAKGWALYLTGTKDTNRLLLVEASKNLLNWSVLSEANPELWLRQTQKPRESSITLGDKAPEREPSPSAEYQHDAPDLGRSPKTEIQFDEGQWQSPAVTQDGIRMKIDASVSVGSPPNRPGIESPLSQEVIQEANEPAVLPAVKPLPEEPPKIAAPRPPWLQRMKAAMRRHWRLAFIPLAALGVGLVFVILWANAKGRQWDRTTRGKIKPAVAHDLGVLVLKYGDRTYQLGPIDRLPTVGVGRHKDNAVRLVDDSVRDHHLRIYRKGEGLMVQNLANTPIKVNTTEVEPRGRAPIGLTGTIQLNDKIKLTLDILRPKSSHEENGSVNHEKPTEKALAAALNLH